MNANSSTGAAGVASATSLLYLLHARSPMHMGTGAALDGIDLPHSREVSTTLPNAPGSGVKGVLRDELREPLGPEKHLRLFGSDRDAVDNRDQGALIFSDALLLCLPVASYAGGFAWVTSPMCLRRLVREGTACGLPFPATPLPTPAGEIASCTTDSPLAAGGKVYLHDIRLDVMNGPRTHADEVAKRLASMLFADDEEGRRDFERRLLVVDEPVLAYLGVAAMDVRTRIALDDDTKTVRDGHLWTEENLPPDAVLWGSIAADTVQDRENQRFPAAESLNDLYAACGAGRRMQIGGKATVGRGIVQMHLKRGGQGATS